MRVLLAAVWIASGCTPAQQQQPNKHAHTRPLSAEEHLTEAQRHSRVADAEEAASARSNDRVETRCVAGRADSESRIGTEPIRVAHPCFTSVVDPTADHLREARENRAEARKHRTSAANLIETETRSCANLDEEAMSHSPFYHREDITAVEALVRDGATVGVLVTFAKVHGLTREWMERSLICHQARAAALGYPRTYMLPHSLSSVRGAEISVRNANGHIVVEVRGEDGSSAAEILGRALGLQASLREHDRTRAESKTQNEN